ncbi:MAG: hypothetical protein KGS48_10865 [Bacteroidetes bacterium]|nr:hypothetical protein [Bacteroidota bacterium]
MKKNVLLFGLFIGLAWMFTNCAKDGCESTVWYADADGDGLGNKLETTSGCDRPSKYTGNSSDIDDNNKEVGDEKDMAVAVKRSTQTRKVYAPTKYLSANSFKQHDPRIPDGVNAYIQAIQSGQLSGDSLEIRRIFQDSNIVVMHSRLILNPTTSWVEFNVFRLENGSIVEHWNNRSPMVDDMDSTTQFNGVTRISASVSTSATKKLIAQAADELFIKGNWSKVGNYFDLSKFAQHRTGWGGNGAAFRDSVALIPDGTPYYQSIKFLYAKGDFALLMSEGYPDPNGSSGLPTAHFDLFRVSNNKIVEHWDVVEEILPASQWANSNGKW